MKFSSDLRNPRPSISDAEILSLEKLMLAAADKSSFEIVPSSMLAEVIELSNTEMALSEIYDLGVLRRGIRVGAPYPVPVSISS